MLPEIYADGLGGITFSNGMVRIDLVSITGGEGRDGKLPTEPHHRLVMTPHAFLQSMSMMQDMMKKLLEAGVVRREPQAHETHQVDPPQGNP